MTAPGTMLQKIYDAHRVALRPYQGKGSLERSTKKRRPPAKIASRLRPQLIRWRKIDRARTDELRSAGLMKNDEQIRYVVRKFQAGGTAALDHKQGRVARHGSIVWWRLQWDSNSSMLPSAS
ncbi:hypothetical protein ACVIHI_008579 [Bradyrhizobium sp. USDA 4524]|uniref:hypothetical protein n=1 Tax=unclassified Bradyrhizobium TaxID=2631580 RepID=UPI0020A0C20E|nr:MULTISPECIES: hypothetical protein [unclassified Bradyrhizobium]MCP1845959.1 hypothetical protein [Bradyrhizobium sp. USDA 4538]MCP1907407.1 hypothetical protein [Bradyrhizobium sp. USDA 4537]MCP1985193.1 hypothetical protein [Bradyrhizobium sp. USDA 4539]